MSTLLLTPNVQATLTKLLLDLFVQEVSSTIGVLVALEDSNSSVSLRTVFYGQHDVLTMFTPAFLPMASMPLSSQSVFSPVVEACDDCELPS